MNTRKVFTFVAGRRMEVLLIVLSVFLILALAGDSRDVQKAPEPTNTPTWMAWLISTFTSTSTATKTTTPVPSDTPDWSLMSDLIFATMPTPIMQMPDQWEVSDAEVQFASFWEGFYSQRYNDGNSPDQPGFYAIDGSGTGNCTIGYGNLLHIGSCNGSESMASISKYQAQVLLRTQLNHCGTYVAKYVKVPLDQNQYDILSGLVCGWGYERFAQSKVLALLNQGRYMEAADQLRVTAIYGIGGCGPYPGLVRRRAVEAEKFVAPPGVPVYPFSEHPLVTPTPQ